MKKHIVGLILSVLCMLAVLSAMSFSVFADETIYIKSVTVSGFAPPVAGAKAGYASLTTDKSMVKVENNVCGAWVRTYDHKPIYQNDKLMSGTEYTYRFCLVVSGSYSFDKSCKVNVGGKIIPAENLEIYYSGSSGVRVTRMYITTEGYYTDGQKREFIDEIVIRGTAQPILGVSDNAYVAEVPTGAPYNVNRVSWVAYDKQGRSFSVNVDENKFNQSDRYCKSIDIEFSEKYAVSDNTRVVLEDAVGEPTKALIISREANKATVRLEYNVKQPTIPTVTFNANGGHFSNGAETSAWSTRYDGTFEFLPEERTVIRSGYSFEGWYTEPVGGDRVDETETFFADTILYAQWKEAISEVRINGLVLPMPGRKPVFVESVPDGAEYRIEYSGWLSEEAGITNNAAANDYLKSEGMPLLTAFDEDEFYSYEANVVSVSGKKFAANAKYYINGVEIEKKNSEISLESVSIKCQYYAHESSFKVYNENPITIPSGIIGSEITQVDLKDYISAPDGFTISAPAGFPFELKSDRYICGTRPDHATGDATYTLTVTSDKKNGQLKIKVGATVAEAMVLKQPIAAKVDCAKGDRAVLNVEVAAANSTALTYSWQFFNLGDKKWYDLSMLASSGLLEFSGENTANLAIGAKDIAGNLKFRCKIKADGKTFYSDVADVVATHLLSGVFNVLGASEKAEKHSTECTECKTVIKEAHVFKYTLLKVPDGVQKGEYSKVCIECGYSINLQYESSSASKAVLNIYTDGDEMPEKVRIVNMYSMQAPLGYYPVREGYTFVGWSLVRDSDTADYLADDEIFCVGEMSLYAVWDEIAVWIDGIPVPSGKQVDVFGDGSVTVEPQNRKRGPLVILDGADFSTSPIINMSGEAAIYSHAPICAVLSGDNLITADRVNGVAVKSDENVTFDGDGRLVINATVSDVKAVAADSVDIVDGSIVLNGCTYGFVTDRLTYYNGRVEVRAGERKAGEYFGLGSDIVIDSLYDAKIFADSEEIDADDPKIQSAAKIVIKVSPDFDITYKYIDESDCYISGRRINVFRDCGHCVLRPVAKGYERMAGDVNGSGCFVYTVPDDVSALIIKGRLAGDADGDGAVSLDDLTAVCRYLAGWSDYKSVDIICDINGDGSVDTVDALYIARHIAGIVGYENPDYAG